MYMATLIPYGIMILGTVIIICGLTFTLKEEQAKGDKLGRLFDAFLSFITGVPGTIAGFFIWLGLIIFVIGMLFLSL